MSHHAGDLFVDAQRRVLLTGAVFGLILALTTAAWSQQAQVAPSQPPSAPTPSAEPPPAIEPPPKSNPGLVEEIGKLLKESVTGLKESATGLTSKLPSARETIDGINSSAKDATDNLSRINPIASQTMVSGRAACPAAANGAPDCKAASDRLCKEKGYKEGKSLDIESAEKCSARVYLSGRTGAPGECRTENFVTRAVCQ